MDAFIESLVGHALCAKPTLYLTRQLVEGLIADGIEGDYVECGVYQGAQTAIMARVLQKHDYPGTVHLFDSFEGIPEAGPEDALQPGIGAKAPDATGRLVSSGVSVCGLEDVKANMARWGVEPQRARYYKGWFQDTLPGFDCPPLAFLRIDGDLYESTKVALEHLEKHVVPGGIVMCDDYGDKSIGAWKAWEEYLEGRSYMMFTRDGATNVVWMVK